MKIIESTVAMAAQRSYQEQRQAKLNIRIEHNSAPTPRPEVTISDAGQAKAAQAVDVNEAIENDPRLSLIKTLLEYLLGHEIELNRFKASDSEQAAAQIPDANAAAESTNAEQQDGMAIEYQENYQETESVAFQAAGIIKTADGREIQFHAELDMTRSYNESFSFSAASGSLARPKKDPLILNYAAPAATLSSQTFAFDIDADGQSDNISLLTQGSAFLALDRDHDGKINDGKELFGTQNGNGFADLASHDSDHNDWIDENDAVFASLRLWIKDASGTDRLVDLKSMGIGALYLGSAKADFSLTDRQNRELGQTRATGVYLKEDGSGGTLQQVDLAV